MRWMPKLSWVRGGKRLPDWCLRHSHPASTEFGEYTRNTIYVTRGSTSSSVYSRITNIDVLCVLTIQTILLHLLDTKPYLEGRDFTQNFPVEEKRRRRATTSHE
ncbi:hypothetical protein L5515_008372 [Caenorhabditis briggsae]|uniref:Uncharacterized protein n=1 Tax=Caenorhabditis briggsae TaxID=6238 RepID=A0AAE9F703_CAEBR|nr:hypothetical protein L5515_008372 [Caenorhabditis briggsae]